MSEYLKILTQSAEIRVAEKEQDYLLNKNYLSTELGSFGSIIQNKRGKHENQEIKTHNEESEELLEHYQQIAEETQELVELLKKKNSKLHSDIRDLEVNPNQDKYNELNNEKEKIEENIRVGNKKLENLQDALISELKVYEVEISQLREESFILNRREDEEINGAGGNLAAGLKKVRLSVESANFAVDRMQNELDHKKNKVEALSVQGETARERYDRLLKEKKDLEVRSIQEIVKDKEKRATQVFNELACSEAVLEVMKAKNSEEDELKARQKLKDLEIKLQEKKEENIKLGEKIAELSRTLDRPLQFNRIGSGKKYKKELDYV